MTPYPPDRSRLVRALARLVASPYRDDVVADLVEEYEAEVRLRRGVLGGRVWLTMMLLRSALASRVHGVCADGAVGAPRRRGQMLSSATQDLRYALRSFTRTPGLTIVAVATMSLALAATVAIFAVVNAVILRPLPYPDAGRLVHVQGREGARWAISYPDMVDFRDGSALIDDVAAWEGWRAVRREADGTPTVIDTGWVTPNYFSLLGAVPAAGRFFRPGEGAPGQAPVVVLSHELWRRAFAGRPDAVGGVIELGDAEYEIVGVAPEAFVDPVAAAVFRTRPALWRPMAADTLPNAHDRTWVGYWTIAKLSAGATPASAQADLRAIARRVEPDRSPDAFSVRSFKAVLVRDVERSLIVLFAAVAILLLIACANVANLLLGRASVRAREIAVRASLGAGRLRLVRQMLTESLLLALAAAVPAVPLAAGLSRFVIRQGGVVLPRAESVGFDWVVFAFALGAASAAAVLFGLAPALHATGARMARALRAAGRGADTAPGGRRLRHALVVVETALAVVLLVGAGLLGRTFWHLARIDPGFDASAVLTVRAIVGGAGDEPAASVNTRVRRLVEEIAAVPSVTGVGAITDLPMSGAVNSTLVGRTDRPADDPVRALVRAVTPGYFASMGVALARGRVFTWADAPGAPDVAVVNTAFARRLFADEDPVGREIDVRGVACRIVGVVDRVVEFTLAEAEQLAVYTSFPQERQSWMRTAVTLTARTGGDPAALAGAVRAAVRRADGSVAVSGIRPMASLVEADVAAPRLRALLIGLFAGTALALAAIGIAGVLGYTVTQRLPEMGLRLALGADPRGIVRLVLAQSGRLVGGGLAIGLVAAGLATRVIGSFLVGVPTGDPTVLVGVAALLAGVALVASWLPARRAARVDPATALRAD